MDVPFRKVLIVGFTACLSASAAAQFSFETGVNYPVGIEPSGAAAADLNGDKIVDLAVTADIAVSQDRIAILLGIGDGTFASPFYVVLPNSSSPEAVVAGDLDGDGDNDLAVGLKDFNQVIVVINDGTASFTLGAAAPTGAEPRGMDIANIDGDNDLDLVVANRSGNTATVLRNNGNATFIATTLIAGAEPRDAKLGDFNHDGDLDLAVSNHDARSISVYQNDGAGAFTLLMTLLVNPSDRPEGMYAADVNNDGNADIVTATGDDTPSQNRITVFLSNGTGFSGPMLFSAGSGALDTDYVVLADFDCDGDLDVATANKTSNNISVLANNGQGSFSSPQTFPAGSAPEHLLVADIAGNGYADLVAVNRNSGNITVMINNNPNCGVEPLGDVTGDGIVNVADMLLVISSWGQCARCAADLNDNGVVNVADLLIVINHWG